MSETQTERLRQCPFCGGEPALNVIDDSEHGMVVTEIRCKKCHSAGRTNVSYNHSVVVGSEAHNDVVHKIVMDWNRREEVPKNTKQLQDICSTLLSLSVLLEKGLTITQNLTLDYFGSSKKTHEKNNGARLLYNYDEARVFSEIVLDYINEALQITDSLSDSIEL